MADPGTRLALALYRLAKRCRRDELDQSMRRVSELPVASQLAYLRAEATRLVLMLERHDLAPELGRLAALLAELAVFASEASDELARRFEGS